MVVLENSDMIGLDYVRTGQVTTAEHEIICLLAMVIRSECDYMSICDSLGVPLEYGTQATPKYGTWMLQTEATLMKFFSWYTSFLYKMAHVRTAFNACGYLTFCDETLVSMGHKISVINDYASVHNPSNARSSADCKFSEGRKGKGSPSMSRNTQDSAGDSVETETSEQLHVENNRATPPGPGKSSLKKSAQKLKPIIEYKDVSNQIELSDENIQGIVSFRFERNEVDGETPREMLQNLDPTVVLKDIHKDK